MVRVSFTAAIVAVALVAAQPGIASAKDKVRAKIAGETLSITGTGGAETVALRLRAGDPTTLEIDAGNDGSADFEFKRDRFSQIVVDVAGGNDVVLVDEVNGIFTNTEATTILGGAGDDTVTGGSGGETLDGGDGDDTILARAGNDTVNGGDGNDSLTGGDGDDQVFGGAGDDRLVWNPGDDSDLDEGGDGTDTVEVNGGNGSEVFTVTAVSPRVRFDRITPAPFSLDIGTTENLVINMNGGDDTLSATGNLAVLIAITADGGTGNDTIGGSNGADVLLGGDGNDTIDGQQGNDVALLGAGDDSFQWDPGDGSDTVEGQAGTDRIVFNGANIAEHIDLAANGGRVRLSRDIASITIDLNDVELVELNTLGGADTVDVGNLAGTDVTTVAVNLAAVGGITGDGQPDTVIVNGTDGPDVIDVVGSGTSVSVVGLTAQVNVTNSEGTNDALVVNALGGNDTVNATTLPNGIIKPTLDGGTGNDTLSGSPAVDVLLGGDGNDSLRGGDGDDQVFGGAGDDRLVWNPGDDSDLDEGGDGTDTVVFNGANISEHFDISANGGRVRLFRDIANVTLDLDDVEVASINTLGGADTVTVGDLAGTDLTSVAVDLAATLGGSTGDAQPDTVIVNGTNNADVINVSGAGTSPSVGGLTAQINITNSEGANDALVVHGLAGDDTLTATTLAAGVINLTVEGGRDDDVALLSAGADVFRWNPGDGNDTVEGQAGTDRLVFNGANINEHIDLAANGGRVRLSRDVASITMDLKDVERVDVNPLGGPDTIDVGNLAGTDVTSVGANLAGILGGTTGDGQPDTVVVNGTDGADVAIAAGDAAGVIVTGIAAAVQITGADATTDTLSIQVLAGDDVVDGSALTADAIGLHVFGGDGDDVLLGGEGDDSLFGEAGDDILIGNGGLDVLDGGPGNNIVIQ